MTRLLVEHRMPVAQDVALIEAGFDVKVNERAAVGLSRPIRK